MKKEESEEDIIFQIVIEIITNKEFRFPIKNFIDTYSDMFFGVEENTHEQYEIHKKFCAFLEEHLTECLKNCGITNDMFLLAAKKGINDPTYSKYFNELIGFTKYTFFKATLTKRNLRLQKKAFERMIEEEEKKPSKNPDKTKKALLKIYKAQEEEDMKNAVKLSEALKEEQEKLQKMEEEQLKEAIKQSLITSEKETKKAKSSSKAAEPVKSNNEIIQEFKGLLLDEKEKEKELKDFDEMQKKKKEENDKKIAKFFHQKKEEKTSFLDAEIDEIEKEKQQKLKEYAEQIKKLDYEARFESPSEFSEIVEDEPKKENINPDSVEAKKMTLRQQLANRLKLKRNAFNP